MCKLKLYHESHFISNNVGQITYSEKCKISISNKTSFKLVENFVKWVWVEYLLVLEQAHNSMNLCFIELQSFEFHLALS